MQGILKIPHWYENQVRRNNGNIIHLQRRGLKQDGQHGNIGNLYLSYNGNQPMVLKKDAEPIL